MSHVYPPAVNAAIAARSRSLTTPVSPVRRRPKAALSQTTLPSGIVKTFSSSQPGSQELPRRIDPILKEAGAIRLKGSCDCFHGAKEKGEPLRGSPLLRGRLRERNAGARLALDGDLLVALVVALHVEADYLVGNA